MTNAASRFLAHFVTTYDATIVRVLDALAFAWGLLSGRVELGGTSFLGFKSSRAAYIAVPAHFVHVDALGIEVSDPIDAYRAMDLRRDRLSPIDPDTVSFALGWSDAERVWKVAMIRKADLDRLERSNSQPQAKRVLGFRYQRGDVSFVFRTPAAYRAWRRVTALTASLVVALFLSTVGFTTAFEARSSRWLEQAQLTRNTLLNEIRALPTDVTPADGGDLASALVARLDLIAMARPAEWRLLTVREQDDGWAVLMDVPANAVGDFAAALQESALVSQISQRQLGVRNGVARNEYMIAWPEGVE